jgi:hypothetical protein
LQFGFCTKWKNEGIFRISVKNKFPVYCGDAIMRRDTKTRGDPIDTHEAMGGGVGGGND